MRELDNQVYEWETKFDEKVRVFKWSKGKEASKRVADITYLRAEIIKRRKTIEELFSQVETGLLRLSEELTEVEHLPLRIASINTFCIFAALRLIAHLRYFERYISHSQLEPPRGTWLARSYPIGKHYLKCPTHFEDLPEIGYYGFAIYPDRNDLPRLVFPDEPLFDFDTTFVVGRVGTDMSSSDYERYALPASVAREAFAAYRERAPAQDVYIRWILPEALLRGWPPLPPERRWVVLLEDKSQQDLPGLF